MSVTERPWWVMPETRHERELRERRELEARPHRRCKACGRKFPIFGARRYCSSKCAAEGNRRNSRLWQRARKKKRSAA